MIYLSVGKLEFVDFLFVVNSFDFEDPWAWDEEQEEWYFSIVDVVAILTDQLDARHASTYWMVLKSS